MTSQIRTLGFYLMNVAKAGDDPAGDLIRDARREILNLRFPEVRTWGGFRNYLQSRGACDDAMLAGKVVFARWRRWQARQEATR